MALHEIGHTLGLDDNTEPYSVMRGWYKHPWTTDKVYNRPQLSAEDIQRIQALYGKNTGNENLYLRTLWYKLAFFFQLSFCNEGKNFINVPHVPTFLEPTTTKGPRTPTPKWNVTTTERPLG